MNGKKLGKIKQFDFGIFDGYRFGVRFELGGEAWGVQDEKSFFVKFNPNAKTWDMETMKEEYASIMFYIRDLLTKAKSSNINDLVGIPVECTFEGNLLRSWRILEEVL